MTAAGPLVNPGVILEDHGSARLGEREASLPWGCPTLPPRQQPTERGACTIPLNLSSAWAAPPTAAAAGFPRGHREQRASCGPCLPPPPPQLHCRQGGCDGALSPPRNMHLANLAANFLNSGGCRGGRTPGACPGRAGAGGGGGGRQRSWSRRLSLSLSPRPNVQTAQPPHAQVTAPGRGPCICGWIRRTPEPRNLCLLISNWPLSAFLCDHGIFDTWSWPGNADSSLLLPFAPASQPLSLSPRHAPSPPKSP